MPPLWHRFSWGKNTVVFATCPTPGRAARLQSWLSESLPLYLSSAAAAAPFRGSFLGSFLPSLGGSRRIRFGDGGAAVKSGRAIAVAGVAGGDVGTGVPTKEELLAVMERFEER